MMPAERRLDREPLDHISSEQAQGTLLSLRSRPPRGEAPARAIGLRFHDDAVGMNGRGGKERTRSLFDRSPIAQVRDETKHPKAFFTGRRCERAQTVVQGLTGGSVHEPLFARTGT